MVDKQKQGKKNRASGAAFERKVRADLEQKGWIVDKWTNNVEIVKSPNEKGEQLIVPEECKLIPAKSNRFNMRSTGFPDFIAFQNFVGTECGYSFKEFEVESELEGCSTIIAVECKSNGYLDKTEKEKCQWYLDNNVFSMILIAYKEKEGRNVVVRYKEFQKE